MEELANLDTTTIVFIAVLWLIQVSLLLWALIDIIKRPTEQVRGGTKWPWILLILFINLVGSVVYLAAGRLPAVVRGTSEPTLDTDTTQRAVDTLYGDRESQ